MADLNQDGVSMSLFELLWTKDELKFSASVNIPDTIVFRSGNPTNWYFTSLSGTVKKKNKHNLFNARIEEEFTKNILGYDVIASFITMSLNREEKSPLIIEFLDYDGLKQLLYNNPKKNGILQRFIDPRGNKNEVIRAIWSPKLCLLERYENIHVLHDQRYGIYERCITCEGPEYYCNSAPMRGSALAGQVQKICESVVAHISEVTFGQKLVNRMVLTFKMDSRDKLWLLYPTSMRCDDTNERPVFDTTKVQFTKIDRKALNISNCVAISPKRDLNPIISHVKIVPRQRLLCVSCAREVVETMTHPVSYKVIIRHYEHVISLLREVAPPASPGSPSNGSPSKSKIQHIKWPPDQEVIAATGGVGFGFVTGDPTNPDYVAVSGKKKLVNVDQDHAIPIIIHHLHPNLDAANYKKCKLDPLFQYKTVAVCESCYLVYSEFATMVLRMGRNIKSMLSPSLASLESTIELHVPHIVRPKSAEWRAMSAAHRSRFEERLSASYNEQNTFITKDSLGLLATSEFIPSAFHEQAKKTAIGLRTSDIRLQPEIPDPIRNQEAAEQTVKNVATLWNVPNTTLNRSVFDGGESSATEALEHTKGILGPTDSSIAARERRFFKTVAKDPKLSDQHPLMHLISSQRKMELANEQSGVLLSSAAAKREGLYSGVYGRQGTDRHDKFGPYRSILECYVNGKPLLDTSMGGSALIPRAADKTRKLFAFTGGDSMKQGAEQKPSAHRLFLETTLRQLTDDIDAAKAEKKSSERTADQFSVTTYPGGKTP